MFEEMKVEPRIARLVEIAARQAGLPLVTSLCKKPPFLVAAGNLISGDYLYPPREKDSRLQIEAIGSTVIAAHSGRDLSHQRQRALRQDQR